MSREQLDKLCERGVGGLVVAMLVLAPLAMGAVRPPELLIIQALAVATLVLWLARIWINRTSRLLWPPICWAVLAFLIYAVLRCGHADLEYVARGELAQVLTCGIVFFAVLNNLARQESVQRITNILTCLAMLISLYAIYQFATGSNHVWHFVRPSNYEGRGSGTFINPNHLAGYLEMIAPLAASFALTGRVSVLHRILLTYASLVILAGIAVTMSRGGWVATGGSFLFLFGWLVTIRQFRARAVTLAVILILCGVGFYSSTRAAQHRIAEISKKDAPVESSNLRLELAKRTVLMWRDHLIWGVGPGHFDHRFPQYRPQVIQARPGYVHNDILNTAVDWGIVGLTIAITIWICLFVGVAQCAKWVKRSEGALETKPSNKAAFLMGATTSLVAITIHSLFDFNLHIPANAILVVTLTAMISSYVRFLTESCWRSLGWAGRVLVSLTGLTTIIFLVSFGSARAMEYRWFDRARYQKAPEQILESLKQAATLEPANFETTYAIGESLRRLSWQGEPGFEKQAREAIEWFSRGAQLNPYDPNNSMRIGMCLDWLGRHEEAAPYYEKALKLDPNNYYLQAHQGWHFVQTGDFEKAKFWFERSWSMNWWNNPIAANYLLIVERKLKENQTPK